MASDVRACPQCGSVPVSELMTVSAANLQNIEEIFALVDTRLAGACTLVTGRRRQGLLEARRAIGSLRDVLVPNFRRTVSGAAVLGAGQGVAE